MRLPFFRQWWPWLAAIGLFTLCIAEGGTSVRVLGDSGSYLSGLFFRGPIYPAFLRLVLSKSTIAAPLDLTGHSYESVGLAQKALALVAFSGFTAWLAKQHPWLPLLLIGSAIVGGYLVGVDIALYFRTYLTWIMTEGLVMTWLITVFWLLGWAMFHRSPFGYLALAPLCLFGVLLAPRLLVFSLATFVPLIGELKKRESSPERSALYASGMAPVLFALLFLAASFQTYRRYRAFTPVDFNGIAFIGPTLAFLDERDAERFEDPVERRFVQLAAASSRRLPDHDGFINENQWVEGPRLLQAALGKHEPMRLGARVRFFSEVSGRLLHSRRLLFRWARWTFGALREHFRQYPALVILAIVLCLPYAFSSTPTPWHALAFCAGALHLANVLFTIPLCGVDGRYLLTSGLLVPPSMSFLFPPVVARPRRSRSNSCDNEVASELALFAKTRSA